MKLKDYFRKYKQGGLYIKILLVFSAILILSVILSVGIIYSSLSSQVKSTIVSLADNALEHTRTVVENEMEELYIYAGTVGENIPMGKRYREMSIVEKQALSNDFFGRFYSYSYFDSVYLYYIEDKIVVSNKFGTSQLMDFTDQGWYGVYAQERAASHVPVLIYDRYNPATRRDVMTYIYEYPKYSDNPKVALVINVSRQRAFEVGDVMPENTQLMILDNSGQLIYGDKALYASTESGTQLGENYIMKDSGSGWKYIAVFDEAQLDLDNRQAVWLLIWVLALGIPIAIGLWVVVSFKLYSPLINLLERLMSISGSGQVAFNEKQQLNYAVDNIRILTDKISDISKRNEEITRCTLLTTLCSGDFEQERVAADMASVGFSRAYSQYAVFLAELIENPSSPAENREQYHVIKMGLANTLENSLAGEQAVLTEFVSRNRILMLAELRDCAKTPAELAGEIETVMKKEYGIAVLVGYGNIAEDVEQISLSYLESMESLRKKAETSQTAAQAVESELKEDNAIKIIKEYIDNHYQEEITLVTMAEKVYLTPNYLSSKFKKVMGIGMIEYVNDLRIEKAKEVLLNSTKNNEAIAAELGFASVRSFLRSFKNSVGKTPTEYRAASAKNQQNT